MDDWLSLALNVLSGKDYPVTALHYFSGLPVETIARLLGISPGTVKSRLFHARKILKKEMEKR